jgi:hypothetical protein
LTPHDHLITTTLPTILALPPQSLRVLIIDHYCDPSSSPSGLKQSPATNPFLAAKNQWKKKKCESSLSVSSSSVSQSAAPNISLNSSASHQTYEETQQQLYSSASKDAVTSKFFSPSMKSSSRDSPPLKIGMGSKRARTMIGVSPAKNISGGATPPKNKKAKGGYFAKVDAGSSSFDYGGMPLHDASQRAPSPSNGGDWQSFDASKLSPVKVSPSFSILSKSKMRPDGFRNRGNMCYLNSTLQALLSTSCFQDDVKSNTWLRLLTEKLASSAKPPPLLMSILKVIAKRDAFHLKQKLDKEKSGDTIEKKITWSDCLDSRGVKAALGGYIERFKSNDQQDAHECLVALLDLLEEEMKALQTEHTAPFNPAQTDGNAMDDVSSPPLAVKSPAAPLTTSGKQLDITPETALRADKSSEGPSITPSEKATLKDATREEGDGERGTTLSGKARWSVNVGEGENHKWVAYPPAAIDAIEAAWKAGSVTTHDITVRDQTYVFYFALTELPPPSSLSLSLPPPPPPSILSLPPSQS